MKERERERMHIDNTIENIYKFRAQLRPGSWGHFPCQSWGLSNVILSLCLNFSVQSCYIPPRCTLRDCWWKTPCRRDNRYRRSCAGRGHGIFFLSVHWWSSLWRESTNGRMWAWLRRKKIWQRCFQRLFRSGRKEQPIFRGLRWLLSKDKCKSLRQP